MGLEIMSFGSKLGLVGYHSTGRLKAADGVTFSLVTGDTLSQPETIDTESPDSPGSIGQQEGFFSFVHWNGVQRLLSIGTDRYGLQPLYYCFRSGTFAFASRVDWLLQLIPGKFQMNWQAFSQYIALRHPFADGTLFEGIQRIPQGAVVEFTPDWHGPRICEVFAYTAMEPEPSLQWEQIIRDGPDALQDAVRRQSKGLHEAVLPLSGGYDSRVLAYGLSRLGIHMTTYTTYKDYAYDTDTVSAKAVAKALGTSHHEVPLTPDYIRVHHSEKCRILDYATSYHLWMMPLLQRLPAGLPPIFDGLGGDGCLGASEADSLEEPWKRKKSDQFLPDYFHWYKTDYERLTSPRWHSTIRRGALSDMAEETGKFFGHPNGLTYLGLRNLTRRAIAHAPFGLLAEKAHCRCPFFDHRLFDWMMSIPIHFKIGGKAYAEILRRFAPELSAIPTTHDIPDGGPYFPRGPSHWKKTENILYLARTAGRLNRYLPGFLPSDLPARCTNGRLSLLERDALLGLADLGLWFDQYHDRIEWEAAPQ